MASLKYRNFGKGLIFLSFSFSFTLKAQSPSSSQEHESSSAHVLYGRHSDFWKEVDGLKNSKDPLGQVNNFFDQKHYGSREGVALADLKFVSESPDFAKQTFNEAMMGMGFHALAGGEAYNRVAPKLRGYTLWDLSLSGSLISSVPLGESGVTGLLGTSLGAGRQKLIQGEATDFFEKVPAQNSTLFYSGFDAGIGYTSQSTEHMTMKYFAQLSPTFFYSEFDDKNYEYGVKKNTQVFRWRTEYEGSFSLNPVRQGGFSLGGQIFSGQQPLPVHITPRTWDAVHDIEVFPRAGSLIGLGLVGRAYNASRKVEFESYGGFYGGYFGGGAALKLYFLRLEAGSFGLEQSSGYRLRESRIEYVGLGLVYDW